MNITESSYRLLSHEEDTRYFFINLNDKDDDFLFATERYDRKILDTSKELMGKKVPLRLHLRMRQRNLVLEKE